MMTQKEIFSKAMELNKETLGSINGIYTEEEQAQLMKIAQCYNYSISLTKTLIMTNQQKEIFLDRVSEFPYSKSRLEEIGFAVCNLYKSEYDIEEDAEEKLNLLCDPNISDLRMSQIWIGIVKDLTLDEIKECLKESDETIVEKTKEIFCKHYNKPYNPTKNEINEER